MGQSEIARIREDIAASYMAAHWGLFGLAYGTSQHRFISARTERIEEGHRALQEIVGDSAVNLVAKTLADVPTKPTRYYLKQVLLHELGDTEETAILLDDIQAAWETMDLLIERFGQEDTQKILTAPSSLETVVSS